MERKTEKEFAALIGWHPQTVANWRKAGKIQYHRAGGSIFYILPDDLDRFWELTKQIPKPKREPKSYLIEGKGF